MNPAPHDEMDPQAAFIAGHEDAKARLGAEPFDASDAHGRRVVYVLTDTRDDVNAMLAAAGCTPSHSANRSIFYDRNGGARSVRDVYAGLTSHFGGGSGKDERTIRLR